MFQEIRFPLLLLIVGRIQLLRLGVRFNRLFLCIIKLSKYTLEKRDYFLRARNCFADCVSIFRAVTSSRLHRNHRCVRVCGIHHEAYFVDIELSELIRFTSVFQRDLACFENVISETEFA